MAYPSTFLDLQNSVIKKARLNATSDLSSVKDWLNQVYAQACIELEANIDKTTATLTAGTSSYDLSVLASGVVRIKQMYVTPVGGTQSRPLRVTSLEQILAWQQASGGATVSNGTVIWYSLSGLNRIDFYPTPGSADTLTIYYVKQPTALSANTDTTILPEPYASKVLEYGTLAEAADFKGDPSETEYRQLHAVWMQKLKAHITRRASGQPGQFNTLPSRLILPHDPSADVGF